MHPRVIEAYLNTYPRSKKKLQEWRNDALYGTQQRDELGVRIQKSGVSDVVSYSVAKLQHPNIIFLQEMCDAIEHTYEEASDELKQFMKDHYWTVYRSPRESSYGKYGMGKVYELNRQVVDSVRGIFELGKP